MMDVSGVKGEFDEEKARKGARGLGLKSRSGWSRIGNFLEKRESGS
jgi:hypothetical protein